MPGVPFTSNYHLNGLEKQAIQYKWESNTFKKVSQTDNNYLIRASPIALFKSYYTNGLGGQCDGSLYKECMRFECNAFEYIKKWAIKTSETEMLYTDVPEGTASKTINYAYSNPNNPQVTTSVTTTSKGDNIEVHNYYPTDFPSVPVYASMIDRHIINSVVKQITTNTSKTIEVGKVLTNYSSFNGGTLLAPASIETSKNAGVLFTEVTLQKYGAKGNLLQYTGRDGVVCSILWGYKDNYPVAKITGVTYDQAVTYINLAVCFNPVSDVALRTELNNLRVNLSGKLISTYTYAPLIGITSQTDPNNKTIYYEYDNFNRLKYIKDQNHNVIKAMNYGYQMPLNGYGNTAISQVFYSQSCATATPLPYTYTVPANTYRSDINQEDANAKAQQQINTQGQAAANTTGACQSTVYARISYENTYSLGGSYTFGDVVVRFYSDVACTIPAAVNSLSVNYQSLDGCSTSGNPIQANKNGGGTYMVLETGAMLYYENFSYDYGYPVSMLSCDVVFSLNSGTGYSIVL